MKSRFRNQEARAMCLALLLIGSVTFSKLHNPSGATFLIFPTGLITLRIRGFAIRKFMVRSGASKLQTRNQGVILYCVKPSDEGRTE